MLVSLEEVRAAARRIQGVARLTPVVDLTETDGRPLAAKCENLQPVGAFKIRGAYNMLAQVPAAELRRGVITYSSGNHGQAVAYAARLLGAPAVVVMPTTAPAVKVAGVRALGAEVIVEGTTSAERQARAEAEAARRGLTIVPPFDHPWIVAGQGTIGLEILDQCPLVDTVVVPVGGGGLIAGIAAAVKQVRPSVRVVGVEPVGAAKMTASLAAGRPVTLERVASLADGLLPVRPGDLTFAHVRVYVDEIVTVDDAAIRGAVAWLFARARLVVEPSGAAALAAVQRGLVAPRAAGVTVVVLSGGNIALETLTACLAR
jgi:threonine dehydratase